MKTISTKTPAKTTLIKTPAKTTLTKTPAKTTLTKTSVKTILTKIPKPKPDPNTLGFGKYFSDHMLTADYSGAGWRDFTISPYAPFALDPATVVLHYGQGVFEGLKAYRTSDGGINLFRPKDNLRRMNNSCNRLCMPDIDVDKFFDAMTQLIKLDRDWIPSKEGTSLYIRPAMIATSAFLGVSASVNYKWFVILSPVGAYYEHGLRPTKIYVEKFYTRAAIGGTGEAKCLGNYATSLKGGENAKKLGYDQVLWLDAANKKYVEEVGSMNMFFVIGDEVITPPLNGSILPGITRDSVIKLLTSLSYKVSERKIGIDEIIAAHKNGSLSEAFGTGTAAVISPVGLLHFDGIDYTVNGGKMGDISAMLYDRLTKIQTGRLKDEFNWITKL
jgi:branched-chain amino acid aminotransferase